MPVKPDNSFKGIKAQKNPAKSAAILKAAQNIFANKGFHEATISDIAKKAGVSQATIYNNFESKAALAREFVTTMVDQLINQAQLVLSPTKPFDKKLTAFVSFISGAIAQGHAPYADQALLSSSLDLQADPEIKEIRDTAQEKMIGLLLEVVREGKEQGFIQSNISEEAFTIYFTAFMNIFTDPQIQVQLFSNPKLVEDLTTFMINGLSSD